MNSFNHPYLALLIFLIICLGTQVSSEFSTETITDEVSATMTFTVARVGSSTFVEVHIPVTTASVAYTTWVDEIVSEVAEGSFRVETLVTTTATLSNSIITSAGTILPTALGAGGYIIACSVGIDGHGACEDQVWVSGGTTTSTDSALPVHPTNTVLATRTLTNGLEAAASSAVDPAGVGITKHRNIIAPTIGGILGGLLLLTFLGIFILRRYNQRVAADKRKRNLMSMGRLSLAPGTGVGRLSGGPFGDSKVQVELPRQQAFGDSKVHLPNAPSYGVDVKEQV